MGRRAKPSFGTELGSERELAAMLGSGAAAVELAGGRGEHPTTQSRRAQRSPGTAKGAQPGFGARNLLHVANRDPNVAGSLAHWHQMQKHARVMAHLERQIAHFASLGEKYKADLERANRSLWLVRIGGVVTYAGLGALALYTYANHKGSKFGGPAHLYTG